VSSPPPDRWPRICEIVGSLLAGSDSETMAAEPALRERPWSCAIQVGNELRRMVVLHRARRHRGWLVTLAACCRCPGPRC